MQQITSTRANYAYRPPLCSRRRSGAAMKTGAASICIRPNYRGGECVRPSMTSSGSPPPVSPPETSATRVLPDSLAARKIREAIIGGGSTLAKIEKLAFACGFLSLFILVFFTYGMRLPHMRLAVRRESAMRLSCGLRETRRRKLFFEMICPIFYEF